MSIYQVVYGYKAITPEMENIKPGASGSATMTYGPNIPPPSETPVARPHGKVFVMNETGATVAKYTL